MILNIFQRFADAVNHSFGSCFKSSEEMFVWNVSNLEILPSFIDFINSLPLWNIPALFYLIIHLYLLIYSESLDKFFHDFCILLKFRILFRLRIGHGDDWVVNFRIEKYWMIMVIVPTLFPKTHDLPKLLLSVDFNVRRDFYSFSDFLLKSIYRFEGLTLLDLFAISYVWNVVLFHFCFTQFLLNIQIFTIL